MLVVKPMASVVNVEGEFSKALDHLPPKLVRKPSGQGPVTAEPLNPNGYHVISMTENSREELTAEFDTYLLYLRRATIHIPNARQRHHLEHFSHIREKAV